MTNHLTSNCRNPPSRGGPASRYGSSYEQNNSTSRQYPPRPCYGCGLTGHLIRDCPNVPTLDQLIAMRQAELAKLIAERGNVANDSVNPPARTAVSNDSAAATSSHRVSDQNRATGDGSRDSAYVLIETGLTSERIKPTEKRTEERHYVSPDELFALTESRLRNDSLAANGSGRRGAFDELLAMCELDEEGNSTSLTKFASLADSLEMDKLKQPASSFVASQFNSQIASMSSNNCPSPANPNDPTKFSKIPSPASPTEPIKITAPASSSDFIKIPSPANSNEFSRFNVSANARQLRKCDSQVASPASVKSK